MYAACAQQDQFVGLYKERQKSVGYMPIVMGDGHLHASLEWLCYTQRMHAERGVIHHSGSRGEQWLYLLDEASKQRRVRVDGYSKSDSGQRFVYEYNTCGISS